MRQKIGDPGSISTQNMFPLTPVVPKPPQLPYGANKLFLTDFSVFQFFALLDPRGILTWNAGVGIGIGMGGGGGVGGWGGEGE